MAAAAEEAQADQAQGLWPMHKLTLLPLPAKEASEAGEAGHVGQAATVVKAAKAAEGGLRKSRAALVLTGALNPVHVGHVASLVGARAALEARGWEVVAGWASPSHESYVKPKMTARRGLYLPTSVRVRCAELAVADTDWIMVGKWESMGPHASWPDYPVVVASLQDHLRAAGRSDVTVFFVCGHDHYLNCGLRDGMRRRSAALSAPGLAVLPRDGSRPVRDKAAAGARGAVVGVEAKHAPPKVSSTEIRRLLRKGKQKQGDKVKNKDTDKDKNKDKGGGSGVGAGFGGGGAIVAAERGMLHPAVARYLEGNFEPVAQTV